MKKLFVLFFIFTLLLCMSGTYAADSISIGIKIDDQNIKERYVSGDRIKVYLTVDEACPDFGLLMGAFEYDTDILRYRKANAEGIEVSDIDDIHTIGPSFFGNGLDDRANQIIFWIEDSQNRLKEGVVGSVVFDVIKGFDLTDLSFNIVKVQAGNYSLTKEFGYNLSTNYLKKEVKEASKSNVEKPSTENDKKANEGNKTSKSTKTSNESEESKSNNDINQTVVKEYLWSKSSNWAIETLEEADLKGLIPDTFNNMDFTRAITRKEFAAVSVKLYEKLSNSLAIPASEDSFTDTTDEYVLKAYSVGITEGTSKEKKLFSPEKEITREQMATMILRVLSKLEINTAVDYNSVKKFVDDSEMHDWSRDAIYFMSEVGIINGISSSENRYGVKNTATIEQALAISLRSVNNFLR